MVINAGTVRSVRRKTKYPNLQTLIGAYHGL
jgi:hypothetical protein